MADITAKTSELGWIILDTTRGLEIPPFKVTVTCRSTLRHLLHTNNMKHLSIPSIEDHPIHSMKGATGRASHEAPPHLASLVRIKTVVMGTTNKDLLLYGHLQVILGVDTVATGSTKHMGPVNGHNSMMGTVAGAIPQLIMAAVAGGFLLHIRMG